MTREAIYTELLARERRLLHQTIAETLEQQVSATGDPHLEDLASHFYQAGVWPKVVHYAQLAGEKALRLYAHRTATADFTRVLEALDHLSVPPPHGVYRARGKAYEALGGTRLRAGRAMVSPGARARRLRSGQSKTAWPPARKNKRRNHALLRRRGRKKVRGLSSMATMKTKSLNTPEETRTLPKTTVEVVSFGNLSLMKLTLEPGWHWPEHVKPSAGVGISTPSRPSK